MCPQGDGWHVFAKPWGGAAAAAESQCAARRREVWVLAPGALSSKYIHCVCGRLPLNNGPDRTNLVASQQRRSSEHCVLQLALPSKLRTGSCCLQKASWQPSRRPVGLCTFAVHTDYTAKEGDGAVLQRPLKAELLADEVVDVFGFSRGLHQK